MLMVVIQHEFLEKQELHVLIMTTDFKVIEICVMIELVCAATTFSIQVRRYFKTASQIDVDQRDSRGTLEIGHPMQR